MPLYWLLILEYQVDCQFVFLDQIIVNIIKMTLNKSIC